MANVVAINIPYLMEIYQKSGMSRNEFSKNVLLRAPNFLTGIIASGVTQPSTADAIIKATGANRERMLTEVPYNPDEYRIKYHIKHNSAKNDEISNQFIEKLCDGMIEIAKNQNRLEELIIQNSKVQSEMAKFMEQILIQINSMRKK